MAHQILLRSQWASLNFVYIHEFGDAWRLNAKLKNMMNERMEVTQGGFITTGFLSRPHRQCSARLHFLILPGCKCDRLNESFLFFLHFLLKTACYCHANVI